MHIAWYPAFTHEVMYAALWDFMQDFQARGLAAWEAFQASRQGRPIPTRCAWRSAKRSPSSVHSGNAICPLPGWRNISAPRHKQGGAGMLASHGRYPCAPFTTARISSGLREGGSPSI